MASISAEQIAAAESVLRPFVTDPAVSVAALFLQALSAFEDAKPGRKKVHKATLAEPEGFSIFYDNYPRRVARKAAEAAYAKALTKSTPEIILAACRRYKASVAGTELTFVAHPGTWLNNCRWADDLGSLKLVGGSGAGFEETSLSGWLHRLELFSGASGGARGSWREAWGPKPKEEGCRVPEEAYTEYRRLYPRNPPKTA